MGDYGGGDVGGGGNGGGYGGGSFGGGYNGSGQVREGDWTCPNCSANVFASKNNCFRCNVSTPPPLPSFLARLHRVTQWFAPFCLSLGYLA